MGFKVNQKMTVPKKKRDCFSLLVDFTLFNVQSQKQTAAFYPTSNSRPPWSKQIWSDPEVKEEDSVPRAPAVGCLFTQGPPPDGKLTQLETSEGATAKNVKVRQTSADRSHKVQIEVGGMNHIRKEEGYETSSDVILDTTFFNESILGEPFPGILCVEQEQLLFLDVARVKNKTKLLQSKKSCSGPI